jgi:hypothetical protein
VLAWSLPVNQRLPPTKAITSILPTTRYMLRHTCLNARFMHMFQPLDPLITCCAPLDPPWVASMNATTNTSKAISGDVNGECNMGN